MAFSANDSRIYSDRHPVDLHRTVLRTAFTSDGINTWFTSERSFPSLSIVRDSSAYFDVDQAPVVISRETPCLVAVLASNSRAESSYPAPHKRLPNHRARPGRSSRVHFGSMPLKKGLVILGEL